jgi:Tol biopolymer transport system component
MNRDGSELRAAWREPRCWMGQIAWLPDGQSVLLSTNVPAVTTAWGPADYHITPVVRSTGAHQTLLDNADSPAISPDGGTLLYVWTSADRSQLELRAAAVDGSDAHTLLDGEKFEHLYAQRFSPDGSRIVFAATGGPQTDAQGNPIGRHAQEEAEPHGALTTVEAERARAEVWTVLRDGSGLQRLTTFAETLPTARFSPDGSQLVVFGRDGIYLLASHGGELRRAAAGRARGGEWLTQP